MPSSDPAVRPRLAGRSSAGLLLVILCAVQFIDAFDVSSMGPALPEIQRDLGMSPDSLQWVVTAYVLGYGGFLLLGGRLADLFDRKRLLIGSLVVFVAASAVGGLATSEEVLIAARFVKGVSAAFSAPAALSILLSSYDEEGARNRALGTYIAISAVGFTSGLILGGVLAAGSWRLVLFVPAALAVILLVVAGPVIPRQERTTISRQPVDVLGALTVTTGLLALVWGVSRAAETGWGSGSTLVVLAAAAVLLVVFVQIQRVHRAPLVPLGIFTRPGVTRGNSAIFLLQGSYVAWQFLATLYLQNVQGWSPIEVGLVFAPGGLLVMLTASRWAGQVAQRGAWPIASAGMVLMVAGIAATLLLGTVGSVLLFLLASTVIGIGYAMCYPAANISAVAAARPDEQGLASGLFIASFQIGSGVILAVVASTFGSAVQADLSSYRSGLLTAGVVAAVALLICLTGLRRRPQLPDATAQALDEPSPPSEAAAAR